MFSRRSLLHTQTSLPFLRLPPTHLTWVLGEGRLSPDWLLTGRQVLWRYGQGTVPRLQPPFWKRFFLQEGRCYMHTCTPPMFVLYGKQLTHFPPAVPWPLEHVTFFPSPEAWCRLRSRHTHFSWASASRLPKASTHTSGNTFSGSKDLVEVRTVRLGRCGAAFATWHLPHSIPHRKEDAALLRHGKVTVSREGLAAVLFPRVESVALS